MFIDRIRELALLTEQYNSGKAELFVLYGRRRVGKTELLRAFCADKPHIFYVADLGTESSALAEFTRQVSRYLFDASDAISPFATWDAAFEFLAKQAAQTRMIVVIDEFTYLIDANDAIPSTLQRLWDTTLRHTQLMLILCGSYVGMMEQHVLAYRSPLYGRRTGQWRLQPLDFWNVHHFLPHYQPSDWVRAYAILGGVPAYLSQFEESMSLVDNIEQRILTQGRFLYDEPRFLMLQELRDPNRYFSVLEAIAGGRTRLNEIAQASGVPPSSITFYPNTLQEMGLVERVVAATETQPRKSKRGIYRLLDPYFRFWFRFVYPNRSLLERGERGQVRVRVEAELDQFVGPAFETICQEYLWRAHAAGNLDFAPKSIGNWWDNQEEIDVVAVGSGRILVGECKWTTKPIGLNILESLKEKAKRVPLPKQSASVGYALFARSGFTEELRHQAIQEEILLVDLEKVITN